MSTENQSGRAILPRAHAIDGSGPATSPLEPSSNLSLAKGGGGTLNTRSNIRSACLACRRRRSKCSGGNPCTRCRALETDCIYNELQDGRTRALREKGKEELDLHRRVLNGLFKAVREGKEQELLDLIRDGASIEEVAIAIDESNTESRSESTAVTPESQLPGGRNLPDGIHPRPLTDLENPSSMIHSTGQVRVGQPMSMKHVLPPHIRDDRNHPLGSVYVDFRDAARRMIEEEGVSAANILSGPDVPCGAIWGTDRPMGPFGVAVWAATVIKGVPGPDILFRLAWLCYITRFIRWTIQPSDETFDRVPPAMIPTPLQMMVPHPPIIDLVPIPQIRDLMIDNYRDFTAALDVAGATVHWTESIRDAVDQNPSTGEMTVSARFESHVSNIDNFCFGRRLLYIFPELDGQLNIAEQDQILSVSSSEPRMET